MQKSTGPIGNHRKGVPFHIYGTGISGLLIGHYLKQRGQKIKLFEISNRTGGKISTKKGNLGIAEQAANAVFTNDDVIELLEDLKLEYVQSNEKLKRKVWRGSRKNIKLLSFFEILKIIVSIFKTTPKITDDLTVKDFFLPLLGKRVCDQVLSSALSGIYATTSDNLHFLSIFKISSDFKGNYLSFFRELKRSRKSKHKPTSISFKNGMQDFIDCLSDKLKDDIHLNSNPSLDKTVNNIICTDATDASEILRNSHPELASKLKEIKYLPLSTSTYILNTEIKELDQSFGMLFPRNLGFETMGVLNNTAIFNRGLDNNLYSYTFITPKDDNLKDTHLTEMKKITEKDLEFNIKFESHRIWKRGIPHYNKDRYKVIESLRTMIYQYNKGIILFGNYVDGISIREMVSHAKQFANKV